MKERKALNQLEKIRLNKAKILKTMKDFNPKTQSVVEIRKDLEALDLAIKVLWQYVKAGK